MTEAGQTDDNIRNRASCRNKINNRTVIPVTPDEGTSQGERIRSRTNKTL